jgi:hypothetical protein
MIQTLKPDLIPYSKAVEVETLDASTGTYRANISDAYLIVSGMTPFSCGHHGAHNSQLQFPTAATSPQLYSKPRLSTWRPSPNHTP